MVESNDLGITHVEIEHRGQDDDRVLEVRAFGESGEPIANAILRTGMVFYSADPDLNPEVWSAGTELSLSVGDQRVVLTSPDREHHQVLEPAQPALGAFARIHAVATAIEREAGIRFTRENGDGEVAFAMASACAGSRFPTTIGNPKQCCQYGATTYHKIGTGSTSEDKLGYRTYNAACRTSGGATGCDDSTCYYGPCGSHNEAISPAGGNTTSAAVFVPISVPTQCGADSNGATAGGALETPEPYSTQSLWAGTTSSCPYTSCATDGTAGLHFKLTVVCEGGGFGSESVTWNGKSVTCLYAVSNPHIVTQTFWSPYNTEIIVTHSASSWWNGWSGGSCSGTGSCRFTQTLDAEVIGTFHQ